MGTALLGVGLLARAQLRPEGPGDASGHYTDHLRHEGEALILAEQGLAVYRRPYGELISAQGLDPSHGGLFPERTAPYPPLAILAHWPLAKAEQRGLLSPAAAHRGVVWLWTLAALGACAAVVRLTRAGPPLAQAWVALLAAPLLVGIGINGFLDAGYLLCGALACLAWQTDRRALAVGWLAAAAALHFRAAVFAPLGAVALWELRRTRRALALAAAAAALAAPTLIAAGALAGTLESIPAHSPVHLSHPRAPLFLFAGLTLAVTLLLWRAGERLASATVGAAFALAVLERSHGWWHAGVLLGPGLVLATGAQRGRLPWALLLAWTLGGSYLAYRHPWSVFWSWLPFGLWGV